MDQRDAQSQAETMRFRFFFGTMLLVGLTLVLGYWAMQRFAGPSGAGGGAEDFIHLSNVGKNYLDSGDAAKAADAFSKALAMQPNNTNALLNLAIAELRAGQPEPALIHARKARELHPGSGAAQYLEGCAALRLGQFTNAVMALQQAKEIDRTVNAISFQLGRAYQALERWEEARQEFAEVVQFEPDHRAAHYSLSQVLLRLGQADEAKAALETHQALAQGQPSQITDPSVFESCSYTHVNVPFRLEQPAPEGIPVQFADATAAMLGDGAAAYQGPAAILDLLHDGNLSLMVSEGAAGFRWLTNHQGRFEPVGEPMPAPASGAVPSQCLVGDLNNDRVDDVLFLGEEASHAFKFDTNGLITDISMFSQARTIGGRNAILSDVAYTGFLDVLALQGAGGQLAVFQNLETPYFLNTTTNFLQTTVTGLTHVVVADMNGDELQDLLGVRPGQPPLFLLKLRNGKLAPTNSPPSWPASEALAVADLNNDLRNDLVCLSGDALVCLLDGVAEPVRLPLKGWKLSGIHLVDYDNDGWLDILGSGPGLRAWRNLGQKGFRETTASLGLESLDVGLVRHLRAGDLDQDGDRDLLASTDAGLKVIRNDGANANGMIKVHLVGTKSNASGIGIRLELTAGGLRLDRTIQTLPIEIGVGAQSSVNSLTAHWMDFSINFVDLDPKSMDLVRLMEYQINPGSCPFLYTWNGERYEFVTDLLGAAPVGLPLSAFRYVEADPFEQVWLGDGSRFVPKDGRYSLQITEELREVLYLDEARLLAVDHPEGTEVHTTGKMLPGGPFPRPQIMTLHQRRPLREAHTHQNRDVTALLQSMDQERVSPVRLRIPQWRGLAEPHGLVLDFGPLEAGRPFVLALTGWLRFGGGTANVAASLNKNLPFPFPTLMVETMRGRWDPVDVVVGTPAGKTKTILVDLEGKLPESALRLKLDTAFEIHWDRIALFEKAGEEDTSIHELIPDVADLHWRGFSENQSLSWQHPLSPDYDRLLDEPIWRALPEGWCTRYGPVHELIAGTDNALALVNGGDELTLEFRADRLPAVQETVRRDFFLALSGWDKDSDKHCKLGWKVGPLPWHGMDDQAYGVEKRPGPLRDADELMGRYNTRYVGPRTFARGGVRRD